MEGTGLLTAVLVFLFAAVVAVPIAQRLGIGAVLGYLIAGIAIGPWGLGFIRDVDEILHFSELGVVFLMFIIGLELNPAKLWQLRRSIFGVGAGQVVITAAVLGALLYFTQFAWQAAVIGGVGLAMSSTAMALQLMREKGMNRNEGGQLGFSVLLFQDMAVIPALALIPILAGNEGGANDWVKIGLKIAAFAGMLIGGRYLLRPLFRYIVASGVREVFTAAALLVVLGSALFMDALGLSMALGTFIAGILLAESEFQHELEIAIEPFKGLLLGLFYFCRHGIGPRRAVYPFTGCTAGRLGTGLYQKCHLVWFGAGVWLAAFGPFAICRCAQPRRRICFRPVFRGVLSACVECRTTGIAIGGRHLIDDDYAVADAGY